jgi:hypothetical protein
MLLFGERELRELNELSDAEAVKTVATKILSKAADFIADCPRNEVGLDDPQDDPDFEIGG